MRVVGLRKRIMRLLSSLVFFTAVLAAQPQPEVLMPLGSRASSGAAQAPLAAWNDAGLLQWKAGKLETAAASFEAMTVLDGRSRVAWRNLAVAYHSLNQFEKGERAARVAVSLDPLSAKGRYLLGVNMVSQKKMTQEALDNLQAAVREIQDARLPIAIIYLHQGKFAEAQRELAEFAKTRQPGD